MFKLEKAHPLEHLGSGFRAMRFGSVVPVVLKVFSGVHLASFQFAVLWVRLQPGDSGIMGSYRKV